VPFLRWLRRALGLALIWLGCNGLDGASWLVGGPVVLAAAAVSLKLAPTIPWRWTVRGALGFGWFFLCESLRGGWGVARHALSPQLRFSPGLVRHPLHLPPGPARLFFCNVISLLPGTAVVEIETDALCAHVLDLSPEAGRELRDLERRVAVLFGVALQRREEVAS
jgi:multicomponent Na+:H+ antiporter subunit E